VGALPRATIDVTQPVALPPVKRPEDVTSRDDRFHCVPYSASGKPLHMLVSGCVKRQATVRAGRKAFEWDRCVNCALGQQIEKNSGGPVSLYETGTDSLGRAKGGWHGENRFGRGHGTKEAKPAPFVGELPPCNHPSGCAKPRARAGTKVDGAEGFCHGHRVSIAKLAHAAARGAAPTTSSTPGVKTAPPAPSKPPVERPAETFALPKKPPGVRADPEVIPTPDPTPRRVEKSDDEAPIIMRWAKEEQEMVRKYLPKQCCTHPSGCKVGLRPGSLREPPPKGTETLCQLHRDEFIAKNRSPRALKPREEIRERKVKRSAKWHAEQAKLATVGKAVVAAPALGGLGALLLKAQAIRAAKSRVVEILAELSVDDRRIVLADVVYDEVGA
jgi:hypothetical protein